MRTGLLFRFSLASLLLGIPTWGGAQPSEAPAPARNSYYAAGETVDVPRVVSGDVVVAGRAITLSNVVEGDVLAAGWRVALTGHARDDVRIAGREVEIAGPVDGDLTVGGAEVRVAPATRIAGRAWLTGGVIEANGRFERELRLAGGTVRLGGEFRQPVHVIAETLEVLPSARLLGAFTYESPKAAAISEQASIAGPTTYRRVSEREARDAHAFRVVSSLFFAVNLLLAGLLVLWLMPAAVAGLLNTMQSAPARSGLVGLGVMVAAPLAALVLVITLIGWPIGLAIGALYAVALLVGLIATALRIGEWEAGVFRWHDIGSPRQRRLALVAGVLTLAAIRIVPVFGTLVVILSVAFGVGALGLTLLRASRMAGVTSA